MIRPLPPSARDLYTHYAGICYLVYTASNDYECAGFLFGGLPLASAGCWFGFETR